MTVHQCPHCDLAFSFKTELEWHLREEHIEGAASSSGRNAPAGR